VMMMLVDSWSSWLFIGKEYFQGIVI
jgi:hypothetical protein